MPNPEQSGQSQEQRITRRMFLGAFLASVSGAAAVGGLTDSAIGAFQTEGGHSQGRILLDAALGVGGTYVSGRAMDVMNARISGVVQATETFPPGKDIDSMTPQEFNAAILQMERVLGIVDERESPHDNHS